jgi:hypothetical protein
MINSIGLGIDGEFQLYVQCYDNIVVHIQGQSVKNQRHMFHPVAFPLCNYNTVICKYSDIRDSRFASGPIITNVY